MGTNSNPEPARHPRNAANTSDDPQVGVEERCNEPYAALERGFIDEFLATRGYTLKSVDRLPPGERELILRAAAAFATLTPAELEARAHYVQEMK